MKINKLISSAFQITLIFGVISNCALAKDVGFAGENYFVQVKIQWAKKKNSEDQLRFFLKDIEGKEMPLPFSSNPLSRESIEKALLGKCEINSAMRTEMEDMLRGSFMSSFKIVPYISSLLCIIEDISPQDKALFEAVSLKIGAKK